MPKVSLIIPYHDSRFTPFFLARLMASIMEQTSVDYEVILVKEGLPGKTINAGIRKAKGELIKIMCMDDWFSHPYSLKHIVDNFEGNWMIVGSHNNPHPRWTEKVYQGYNTLGGLSTIVMKNDDPIYFDDDLVWMIDVEFYKRAYEKWGEPTILDSINVNIGIHPGQATNLMSDEEKLAEHNILRKRYGE